MAISLTAQYNRSTNDISLYGYTLQVVITDASGMPQEIFVFQRGAAPAPSAGETQYVGRTITAADALATTARWQGKTRHGCGTGSGFAISFGNDFVAHLVFQEK